MSGTLFGGLKKRTRDIWDSKGVEERPQTHDPVEPIKAANQWHILTAAKLTMINVEFMVPFAHAHRRWARHKVEHNYSIVGAIECLDE
uniref:Uncharacterized protein n=1 Tax=Cannabis sativa TaxID=3483 RepID=A0A803PEV9_CANSA